MIEKEKLNIPEIIEGEKIVLLKRFHEYDEEMFRLIDGSRIFLREFLFWVDKVVVTQDVVGTTDKFANKWDEGEAFDYLIVEKKSKKLLGAGGFHNIDYKNHSAELGYFLGQDQVGNGYVSEAVKLLENLIFEREFHRLVIECDVNNFASIKVAERNGYKFEGTLRDHELVYDGYRTHHAFAKINTEEIKND